MASRARDLLRRPGRAAWLILAVALVLRLAVVAATDYQVRDDPKDYDRIGWSLAQGEGYPKSAVAPGGGESAFRPPLYPSFLGAVYATTGKRWNAARAAQAFLGTITVALIGLIGWRLFGRRRGLVAMGIAAVFPPFIVVGAALLSEPLFLPLMLGALLSAIEYRRSRSAGWAVAAGVLVGLAAITRSVGLGLLPAIAALVLVARPRLSRRALAAPAIVTLATALTMAPWVIRNAIVLDSFVPIATEGGFTLAGTYNETARNDPDLPGAYRPANFDPEYARLIARGRPGEVELDERLMDAAIEHAAEHPLYVLEVGARNVPRLFELTGRPWSVNSAASVGLSPRMADFGRLGILLLLPLAIAGAFTTAARRAPAAVWAVPVLMALGGIFVQAFVRMRAPIDPFLVLLASLAVVSLADRAHAYRRERAAARAAAA